MSLIKLACFSIAWIAGVYLFQSILAGKFKKINLKRALLYTSTVAMIGVFGEVFVGNLYHLLFDKPLWLYRIYPIHEGYTSYFAPVIWGIYGFYLYLLHDSLSHRKFNADKYLALIFSIETVLLEIILSLTFLMALGQYIFYYLPGDLWHFTSVQAMPFYLAAGFVIATTLKHLRASPVFYTLMNISLILVLVVLV